MYMVSLLSILPFTAPACGSAQGGGEAPEAPKVYFVRDITPENMVRLYEALERPATGKVAVKLSTGEPGGHNFLKPELIKDLVQKVDDTIVECNTAYGGGFAYADLSDQSQKQRIIDIFVNSVYVYDDRVVIFFNYKDGERYVDFSTLDDLENPAGSNEKKTNTHENECSPLIKSGDPSGNRTRDTLIKSQVLYRLS